MPTFNDRLSVTFNFNFFINNFFCSSLLRVKRPSLGNRRNRFPLKRWKLHRLRLMKFASELLRPAYVIRTHQRSMVWTLKVFFPSCWDTKVLESSKVSVRELLNSRLAIMSFHCTFLNATIVPFVRARKPICVKRFG